MIETGSANTAGNHSVCNASSISSHARSRTLDGLSHACGYGKKNHKETETSCTGFLRPRYGLHIACGCSCHRKAKKQHTTKEILDYADDIFRVP